jgi:hypothetical protein
VVERSEVGDCGGDGTVRTWPRGGLGEGCGDAVGSCSLLPKGGGGGGRAAGCGDGGGLREREDCVPG